VQLRPYQTRAIADLRAKIGRGARRLVLLCPTGGGKTVVAAEMIRSAHAKGRRALVIAHRRELINQTVSKLEQFGVSAGVIMGSDNRRDDFLTTQVASVQTLSRRLDRLPPADLVIPDECHHSLSDTYRRVLDAYPRAVVIGLTATPWRLDKRGLSEVYEGSVLAATPAELIASGSLVPYDAFAYDSPDLHGIETVAGDFNVRELGLACNTEVLVGSILREYLAHARGRRAILFPVDIAHSLELVAKFNAAGVTAAHVDAHTPDRERDETMERFRSGDLMVLSSVGVLTEGFDAPAAEVCIMARPTKSLSLCLQMIGRVLRPCPETGKTRALIHDHAGNLLRHGLPDDERDYSLRATPKRVRALHTCPFCAQVFGGICRDGTCPHCHELIAPPQSECQTCGLPKVQRDNAEQLGYCACAARAARGEKIEIDGQRIDVAEIRARRAAAGLERDLSDRQLAKIARATRAEKAAEYLRLQLVQTRNNLQKGFIGNQFRAVFGHWPRFTTEELADVEPAARPFIPLPPRRQEKAA